MPFINVQFLVAFSVVTTVAGEDDETEKPLLKCYVCSGVNNVCGDAADLGTETTWSPYLQIIDCQISKFYHFSPRISETCIVATGKRH